jgi:glycosyltransferase involved in cell wall biosynthesis
LADKKLRMLIVGAFPRRQIREHGGVLTSCRVLLDSSLPRRAELVLVDSSSPSVPPPPLARRFTRALLRVAVTCWHFARSRPHVALLFASPGSSFVEKSLIAAVARMLGIRTLMFPRGAQLIADYHASPLKAALFRRLFSIPDRLLCQGQVYRDFFTGTLGIDGARCPILANWTATAELLALGESRRYDENARTLTLLFLGWIDREKGVFELLECLRALAARPGLPRLRLLMAGEGSALEAVRRFVREHALESSVELPGWIDGQQKIEALSGADIFVLPSYMEGMPNALIEAMAAGLPVIATAVGAVSDMVDDGSNGLVIEPRDAGALVRAVDTLISTPSLRMALGRAACRTAREKFSAEAAVDSLMALAEELAGTASGRRP